MNKQAALVKLAQVRLAINYVLRSRGLEKRAVIDRYSEDTYNQPVDYQREFENERIRNNPFSYGADPNTMTPDERNEFLGLASDDLMPYWERREYHKPEYEFMHELPFVQNSASYMEFPNGARHIPARYSGDNLDAKLVPGVKPLISWDRLMHNASLPKWHPDHASSDIVNEELSNYYTNIYNGNRDPYYEERTVTNDGITDTGKMVDFGLPLYPVEGVTPVNEYTLEEAFESGDPASSPVFKDFWTSAAKRQLPSIADKY